MQLNSSEKSEYLLAFRHRMQHITTITIKNMHVADILQNAICNGSRGSHQNSVEGGYVGTKTPITVGKYWKIFKQRKSISNS